MVNASRTSFRLLFVKIKDKKLSLKECALWKKNCIGIYISVNHKKHQKYPPQPTFLCQGKRRKNEKTKSPKGTPTQ
jgi:hypothetical protein